MSLLPVTSKVVEKIFCINSCPIDKMKTTLTIVSMHLLETQLSTRQQIDWLKLSINTRRVGMLQSIW